MDTHLAFALPTFVFIATVLFVSRSYVAKFWIMWMQNWWSSFKVSPPTWLRPICAVQVVAQRMSCPDLAALRPRVRRLPFLQRWPGRGFTNQFLPYAQCMCYSEISEIRWVLFHTLLVDVINNHFGNNNSTPSEARFIVLSWSMSIQCGEKSQVKFTHYRMS